MHVNTLRLLKVLLTPKLPLEGGQLRSLQIFRTLFIVRVYNKKHILKVITIIIRILVAKSIKKVYI